MLDCIWPGSTYSPLYSDRLLQSWNSSSRLYLVSTTTELLYETVAIVLLAFHEL
jgi:hypothetical protein